MRGSHTSMDGPHFTYLTRRGCIGSRVSPCLRTAARAQQTQRCAVLPGAALFVLCIAQRSRGGAETDTTHKLVLHTYIFYTLSSERVWLLLHDKMTYDNIYNFPLPVN